MGTHDPRIDAYLAESAEFARPILDHLRRRVHAACPEVEEGIKWGMPFFSYKGAPMCHMAAFKQHCSFGFWLAQEVTGGRDGDGMGQFGKLATLEDLPSGRQLAAYLKKAMALNEAGVRKARPKATAKPAPVAPDDLAALLARRHYAAARKAWESFPPGAQREYVDWLAEAKTDATRRKRLATTLEWLAEGKRRHWKYEKC